VNITIKKDLQHSLSIYFGTNVSRRTEDRGQMTEDGGQMTEDR